MKTLRWVGLIIAALYLSGCATSYSSRGRTVVGTAIAVLVVGAAVHGGRDDEKRLQEDPSRTDK
jgi:hypothetical protein